MNADAFCLVLAVAGVALVFTAVLCFRWRDARRQAQEWRRQSMDPVRAIRR